MCLSALLLLVPRFARVAWLPEPLRGVLRAGEGNELHLILWQGAHRDHGFRQVCRAEDVSKNSWGHVVCCGEWTVKRGCSTKAGAVSSSRAMGELFVQLQIAGVVLFAATAWSRAFRAEFCM